jgi:hypothetical protein
MAENKTKATTLSVAEYIAHIPDESRRADCQRLVDLFQTVTNEPPVMWGAAIVGFGSYHYKYDSGHEGDMARIAMSSRKADIVLYGVACHNESNGLMAQLGKHKVGKACLYIKRLCDIRMDILEKMIRTAY